MKIIRAEKLIRRDLISDILREAIYDVRNDRVLDDLQKKLQLSDDIKFATEEKCQYVFLGFLRIKDVFEELVRDVKLDSKTALAVYQELEQKIFGPYKAQIEENYRAFQSAPQDIAFPHTQEQVVLKSPIDEGAVNLRPVTSGQELGVSGKQSTQQPIQGPIPVSLDTLGGVNKGFGVSEKQTTPTEIKNPFINPVTTQQKSETASPKSDVRSPISENAPFILHKHEDVVPIAQSYAQKGYKQMSFGSFMGAFKAPQTKQQEASHAQVEIPGIPVLAPDENKISPAMQKNTPLQQVPFSVKKYEPQDVQQTTRVGKETAKVVHYTSEENPSDANSKYQAPNHK